MPFDPGAAAVRRHADELGELRNCTGCGRTIRRSYQQDLGVHINLEPHPQPIDPTWPPQWAHQTCRWQISATGTGGAWCAVSFTHTTQPIHLWHHCPATPNP